MSKKSKEDKTVASEQPKLSDKVELSSPGMTEIPDVIILQDMDDILLPPESVMWSKSCCC